jgi:hypothetical protein
MDLGHFIYWLTNEGTALIALVALLGGCGTVLYVAGKMRKNRLVESRRGYNIDCFAAEMDEAGYDPEVARVVYLYIQEMHGVDFPIFPGDDIAQMFGMTDEDVRRALPPILDVCGRRTELGRMMRPLETVEQVVEFVCNVQPAIAYDEYEEAEAYYGEEMEPADWQPHIA